ncbi:MAG TPA: hypothetical protein VN112_20175 [Ensifer sp.]|nr:hypothetical protein [Ensifer sp.]
MRDGDRNGLSELMRLHDIAAAYGDGLIPELYDLLARPAPPVEITGNVVAFPLRQEKPLNNQENLPHDDVITGSKN